jgi:rsbT co-antagonist protein RsbR
VIIDITGVPLVDTAIANHLLQTTKAVTLLGAQTIVVGIGADVAQTLTSLGLDLRHMSIRANLEAGIQTALAARGLGIGPISRR